MRVRLDLGVDFEGTPMVAWEPSRAPNALEVPKATLERWQREREAFLHAMRRWRQVGEEIEEYLFGSDPGGTSSPEA